MTEQTDDDQNSIDQQKAARRAHIWVNAVIFLSSAAGALFLVFVFSKLFPSGFKDQDEVDVPTATLADGISVLTGINESGLSVEIRDVDATEGYADAYTKQLQSDIGIDQIGRLYRLTIANSGEQTLDLASLKIELADGKALQPLSKYSSNPTTLGKLHVMQSNFQRSLPAGGVVQCLVFVSGSNSSVAKMKTAKVSDTSGDFALEKTEIRAQQP
ncbi:MAG: hypothetical protein ACYTDT_03575 [Planctomycetota bacterium]|jgi:hypothetical protein